VIRGKTGRRVASRASRQAGRRVRLSTSLVRMWSAFIAHPAKLRGLPQIDHGQGRDWSRRRWAVSCKADVAAARSPVMGARKLQAGHQVGKRGRTSGIVVRTRRRNRILASWCAFAHHARA
jgi:hypothetical protein